MTCDASLGTRCDAGSSYPLAAAGYFAELTTNEGGDNTTNVVACVPFPYACLGTCSREVEASILSQSSFSTDDEGLSLESCAPGLEAQSCTDGYEGPRCSRCTQFRADFKDATCDADTNPPTVNGYYRLESRCIPCPCTWIKVRATPAGFFFLCVAPVLGYTYVEVDPTRFSPW
jgi:hypothetical protein